MEMDWNGGVTPLPVSQAGNEPLGGKGRRRRDLQGAFMLVGNKPPQGCGDAVEGIGQDRHQGLTGLGQRDTTIAAMKQVKAERGLQLAYLMADRAVGNVEFVGST